MSHADYQSLTAGLSDEPPRFCDLSADRTTRLTPTDPGYVVSHADVRSGEHIDTAITLTEPVHLELDERGHEMVLAERAGERRAASGSR